MPQMKPILYCISVILLSGFAVSCGKDKNGSSVPAITLIGFNKVSPIYIFDSDSPLRPLDETGIDLEIGFADADGDLYSENGDTLYVDVQYAKAGENYNNLERFPLPFKKDFGDDTPYQGKMTLTFNFFNCYTDAMEHATDTIAFKIKLKDKKGNLSNEIITPEIYVQDCFTP